MELFAAVEVAWEIKGERDMFESFFIITAFNFTVVYYVLVYLFTLLYFYECERW